MRIASPKIRQRFAGDSVPNVMRPSRGAASFGPARVSKLHLFLAATGAGTPDRDCRTNRDFRFPPDFPILLALHDDSFPDLHIRQPHLAVDSDSHTNP
jgi:hypothetical protein